uniref:NADH-ubiquinone reductase complex 1 MLRQ subunit n=1 Tax=Ascaris lumbricoides TaxID=6252 RepID=A0A0M3IEL3_ASCLU
MNAARMWSRTSTAGLVRWIARFPHQRTLHWTQIANENSLPLKDAPKRSLVSRFLRKAEIYPMAALGAGVVGMLMYGVAHYAGNVRRFLRRASAAPFDWEQIRDNYYKRHTTVLDPDGSTHKRLEMMEQLKDAMLDASKRDYMKSI